MVDNNKVLGMCNYCQELTRVYEQEDEVRPTFLVCLRCLTDISTRIRLDDLQNRLRRRRAQAQAEDEGYSEDA